MPKVLIAGGGIGGLAAALACSSAGWQVQVVEQAVAFEPIGAGIQLGPNATRILQRWGLGPALSAVASEPRALRVRDARTNATLGLLPLASAMRQRHGAPYFCVHRADLHGLLLAAAQTHGVSVEMGIAMKNIAISDHLTPTCEIFQSENAAASEFQALAAIQPSLQRSTDLIVGADGLWSRVRQQLLPDVDCQPTGHLAWRALVDPAGMPAGVSVQEVSVWLGPQMHLVCYPVRGGALMNLVLITEGQRANAAQGWSHTADAAALQPLLRSLHAAPAALLASVGQANTPPWTQWTLHEHAPISSAAAMAQGRIALLGDAAHAMRPYLAQGGAMALEDAAQLGASLLQFPSDVPTALQAYAKARWQRNARVQRKAQRNGRIFHASGPVAWARNLAMRALGPRLMEAPWLYGFQGPLT
jgi:salicylate hydroxylase